MALLRSAFLLLTLVAFSTRSSGQAVTKAARCRAQQVQCAIHTKEGNTTAMRDSCQQCYYTCRSVSEKQDIEPQINWNYCLNACVDHDCIGDNTRNGVAVTAEYQCKVYKRWCWAAYTFNTQRHDLVNISCGTCAKVCDYPSFVKDRKYCESRNTMVNKASIALEESVLEPADGNHNKYNGTCILERYHDLQVLDDRKNISESFWSVRKYL